MLVLTLRVGGGGGGENVVCESQRRVCLIVVLCVQASDYTPTTEDGRHLLLDSGAC